MGELDHPESTVINLKNVSHLISDYWWDGDNVMGKIEILPTPSGQILKELIKAGVHFGHLTRKWNPNMSPYIYTCAPRVPEYVYVVLCCFGVFAILCHIFCNREERRDDHKVPH